MKVKLYKGPLHGRSMFAPDDEHEMVINHIRGGDLPQFRYSDGDFVPIAPKVQKARYRMVRLSGGILMTRFKLGTIPSVNPDGSFNFQYVEEK